MLIKHSSIPLINFSQQISDWLPKERRLQITIGIVAAAIFCAMLAYFVGCNFWNKYKVEPAHKGSPVAAKPIVVATPVSVCIGLGAGLVGEEMPLSDAVKEMAGAEKFKLEDQSPLPLKRNDTLVRVHFFNVPSDLQISGVYHLPAILFKDKKEGDKVRLCYQDHLLELQLEQTKQPFFKKEAFELVLQHAIERANTQADPLFTSRIYYWYDPKFGNTYRPVYTGSPLMTFEEVSKQNFRALPKLDHEVFDLEISGGIEKGGLHLLFDCPGIDPDNRTHVDNIEIGLFGNKISICYSCPPIPVIHPVSKSQLGVRPGTGPFLGYIDWQQFFKGCTSRQVKEKIEKATLSIRKGEAELLIPV